MSSMMPGAWPTLDGFPDELGCVDAESGAGGTSSSLPRHKMVLGSIRYGVSYSFRKAALKGVLDDLKAGCAEIEKGGAGVEDNTGLGERDGSGQRTNGSSLDMVDDTSDVQATPDSTEDVDMTLPLFPNLATRAGETDWAKYLIWMEDDMSFEERTNNNMLLAGNSIREVSSEEVITHLSLDIGPTAKRRILLFKDLPAMRQGQHDGLAMYILGYDAAESVFFVRRFERLSSKIELLPRYWDCGKEVVWLSVGRVLQILRDVDLGNASTDHASVLPDWDEELGFKVVVVVMLAQWVLDFSGGFWMVAEVAEIAKMLLSRWRESLFTDFAGAMAFVHQFKEKKASQQADQDVSTTEGAKMRSVSKSLCLKTARSLSVCAHETPVHASSPIEDASRDRRNIYDSDEEEEWAALENWAARNKLEKQIKTGNTEPGGKTATSQADLSSDKASEPNKPVPTPERVQSPLDESDLSRLGHTKRFSDSSTLCDGSEENKESSTFINTVRHAMNEGSIEAMLKVYSDFVKEHPDHDSKKKRSDLFKFLVTHVGEKDGGSFPVTETLPVLKKMCLAEGEEGNTAEEKIDIPLEGSKNP